MASKCNGHVTCDVAATSAQFGDPCVGIGKYLQLDFSCQPDAAGESILDTFPPKLVFSSHHRLAADDDDELADSYVTAPASSSAWFERADEIVSRTTCEEALTSITCPPDHVIFIHEAMYGRFDNQT